MLGSDDTRDLEAYFGPAQSAVGKSTFGAVLDRQSAHYRTSDGRIVDSARIVVVQRELAGSTDEAPRFADVLSPWPYLLVHREQSTGGIEPEDLDQALQLLARVGRRLRRLDDGAQWALSLLYGDSGARWCREPQGRCWALVPYTPPARRALERDDAARATKGRPPSPLLPDERLARLASERPRPVWADAALDLAEGEQRRAEAIYAATSDGHDGHGEP